jgi:hypothetical protein
MLLEVSAGEAIDKLTILDIKKEKIEDAEKNKYLIEEFIYLEKYLQDLTSKYKFYYKCLKRINFLIWDLQDKLRCINHQDENYGKLCEKVIFLNDARFMIKNKINLITDSKFKEQKGYQKRNVKLICFLKGRDILHIIYPVVRFLSFLYDETFIIVENLSDAEFLTSIFGDDPTIHVSIENKNTNDKFNIDERTENKNIHPLLVHLQYTDINLINKEVSNIFYNLNLDPNIYIDYSM